MVDDDSPDKPFDPYAPPPPGQQAQPPQGAGYGQPPQGQPYGQPAQGQGPQGHGYYYPQGYTTPYEPAPKRSSLPLWLGALLGVLAFFAGVWVSTFVNPDLFPWVSVGGLIVLILLFVVPATRRWGLGVLIGLALSIPIGMIVFAGVCIALIVGYSQSSS